MQTKQINLQLSPSKLPLVALLFAFVCGYLISRYIPILKYTMFSIFVLMCLFWLYKYLNFKQYNIVINTKPDCHALLVSKARNDSSLRGDCHALQARLAMTRAENDTIPVQIIKFKHISWWLCIIYVLTPVGLKKIYLFADSVPFKLYKTFKIYSQWT
jgi:hypothetical protein